MKKSIILMAAKSWRSLSALALAVWVVVALSAIGVAKGSPIEFIQTGSGSGTIGNISFTSESFTLTSFADTSARILPIFGEAGYMLTNSLSSIDIAGLGTFQLQTGTGEFVNNSRSGVGYMHTLPASTLDYDLFDGPTASAFSTWDMLSSIGPVSGTGELLQWSHGPIPTNGGTLVFNSASTSTTFQAIVTVPEPKSLSLLALFAPTLLTRWGRRVKIPKVIKG